MKEFVHVCEKCVDKLWEDSLRWSLLKRVKKFAKLEIIYNSCATIEVFCAGRVKCVSSIFAHELARFSYFSFVLTIVFEPENEYDCFCMLYIRLAKQNIQIRIRLRARSRYLSV